MTILRNLSKIFIIFCCLFSFSYADTGFGVSEVGTLSSIKLGSISGYVLHGDTPLPYTEVYLQKLINDNWETITIAIATDENAYYSFQELENGSYKIIARYNPTFPELSWILIKIIYINAFEDIEQNTFKGYTINTNYPKDNALAQSPVDFQWEKRDSEKKYRITIIRDEYPFDIVYQTTTVNSYSTDLVSGNYRWCIVGGSSTVGDVFSHFLGSSYYKIFKVDIPQIYYQGIITSNTIWSGEVHITGDVTVNQDVTLTIEPGTKVYIDDHDALSQGTSDYQRNVISINIDGTLIADGTEDNPIKFIPESDFNNADRCFWQGIVLKSNSVLTSMKYCFISCANHGVSINNASPSINYCTLNKSYSGIYINGAQSVPVIEQNNFHSCNICILLDGTVLTPNVHYNNFYAVPLSVTYGNYALMVSSNNSGQDLDFTNNYWGIPSSVMPARIWSSGTNVLWDPALDSHTGSSSWSADLVDWYVPPGWPFGGNALAKTSSEVDSALWSLMSNCLGPADGSYFSLGYGGYLTFDLGVNNSIVDSTGDDIIIYESVVFDSLSTAVEHEAAFILLGNSVDGPWELAAEITGSAGIDIDSLTQDSYRFIKILDVSIGDSLVSDQGFDLDAIRIKNNFIATSIETEKYHSLVKSFSLNQNYPNPFNPTTTISFELFKTDNISIDIFAIDGRHMINIFKGRKSVGLHEIKFNAEGLSSGVYFYKLKVGEISTAKKMILIR